MRSIKFFLPAVFVLAALTGCPLPDQPPPPQIVKVVEVEDGDLRWLAAQDVGRFLGSATVNGAIGAMPGAPGGCFDKDSYRFTNDTAGPLGATISFFRPVTGASVILWKEFAAGAWDFVPSSAVYLSGKTAASIKVDVDPGRRFIISVAGASADSPADYSLVVNGEQVPDPEPIVPQPGPATASVAADEVETIYTTLDANYSLTGVQAIAPFLETATIAGTIDAMPSAADEKFVDIDMYKFVNTAGEPLEATLSFGRPVSDVAIIVDNYSSKDGTWSLDPDSYEFLSNESSVTVPIKAGLGEAFIVDVSGFPDPAPLGYQLVIERADPPPADPEPVPETAGIHDSAGTAQDLGALAGKIVVDPCSIGVEAEPDFYSFNSGPHAEVTIAASWAGAANLLDLYLYVYDKEAGSWVESSSTGTGAGETLTAAVEPNTDYTFDASGVVGTGAYSITIE